MFVLPFLVCLFFTSAPGLVYGKPGFDIPLQRHVRTRARNYKRGEVSGSIGLGDNSDVLYTVPVKLGNSVAAVNIDTGSSDLWVVSDACQIDACQGASVARYPLASAKHTGTDVTFLYGDSTTGTYASGIVGLDTASVAGVAMEDQAFGLINSTNNQIVRFQTAGIFGLGFPSGSKVQEARVVKKHGPVEGTDDFLHATATDGPLLTRIAMSGELEQPMFSITLQRSTVDIGGEGVLTVGKLPAGIDNSSLTWVPVRLYEVNDGGLRPPTFAPNEKYPLRWEVELDGVFLDGERVQDSTIPAVGVNPGKITALIDTGNSILRGPDDMVDAIFGKISPDYNPGNVDDDPLVPCSVPHTIAFQIGGKMFPVDPRDFIGPRAEGDTTTCVADTLVGTDAPRLGSLYRWSLGDPFMKSNLVAFHYGNMTHPSVDPPRIGFLSTVPSNAGALLKQAVEHAKNNGGKFKQTLVPAPTGVAATAAEVTVSIRTTHAEPSGTPARPGMITQTVSADASPATPTSEGRLNKNNAAITITLSLSQHVVFWLGAHFALLFWL